MKPSFSLAKSSFINNFKATSILKYNLLKVSKKVIKMPAYETQEWDNKGYLEIKIDTGSDVGGEDEILPAFKEEIAFEDSDLDWETE